MHSNFYPGFFDSDGRPWEQLAIQDLQYQEALESALKIALLTQRITAIPIGYFLDNPFLHRIVLRYRDASDEEAKHSEQS
jgi:hypothetical protein